jgi:hypothetical protein
MGGARSRLSVVTPATVDTSGAEAVVVRRCRRPSCNKAVRNSARGRPPEFCSTDCARLYRAERNQVAKQLREAEGLACQYGLASATATPTAKPLAQWQGPDLASPLLADLSHAVQLAIARLRRLDEVDRAGRIADDLSSAVESSYASLARLTSDRTEGSDAE